MSKNQQIEGAIQHQHDERLAQPVEHPVQIMQPLHQTVAGAAERAVLQQRYLDRAEAPARALADIFRQALGLGGAFSFDSAKRRPTG
jgi:hypothetical protein